MSGRVERCNKVTKGALCHCLYLFMCVYVQFVMLSREEEVDADDGRV